MDCIAFQNLGHNVIFEVDLRYFNNAFIRL